MSAVTITVEIDGQQYPISECSWYFIGPCGCTHGVMTTTDHEKGGWITTPEHAMAEMTPSKAVREQDIARGERAELGLRGSIKDKLTDDCPHTPQWGNAPIPEGTQWGKSRDGRVAHLVTELASTDDGSAHSHRRVPKCGGEWNYFEIHPSVLNAAPMCKKCLKLGLPSMSTPNEGELPW